jgi:ABC-type transport system substrate-binding protein
VAGETSDEADRLTFGLLGPLRVTRAGAALPFGGRQQRPVLAVLLAEAGAVVSVDRLADALCGEHPPAGYATTIQTYVFHLREVLEPDRIRGAPARVLITEPRGYRLQADEGAVDATHFEQRVHDGQAQLARGEVADAGAMLTAALRLWRGEVLADLADFDFVAPLATRLEQLRRSAIASRIDTELALGRHGASGHADATYGLAGSVTAGTQQISALASDLPTRYPSQFHTEPLWTTRGEGLNLRRAPFNDIQVRRALNYAVDRRTIAAIEGGPIQAEVTCQVLPPRFAGYQPYCPYTTKPRDGTYHRADPDTAKKLIAASPYKGMTATAWNFNDPTSRALGAYLVTELKQLGFRATQHELRAGNLDDYDYIYDPSTRTQLACCVGWGSDFPTSGNFFTGGGGWIGCPASGNYFGYCNPQIDALVKQAEAVQSADPVAASRLCAQADRMVVDDPPMVFDVVNTTFVLTSARVGNYQSNLESGPLWDRMWVH